jgi:hypothetical protein
MPFDEAQYVRDFIKGLRGARALPDDLLARYAITLPAGDAEIAGQVDAVRKYWNKTYSGQSPAAQVARMCRAEDERLRAEHGQAMLTRQWWGQRQSERQAAAEASTTALAEQLRQAYGQLGVVTAGILGQFAARLGLTEAQAGQAATRAGLRTVSGVTLPDAEPIATFAALLKNMSECGAASVPELVHPGAGPFSLVERYVCRDHPAKRLDAVAVEAQSTELDKRGVSATDDARRGALKILRKALKDGVDLREVALYHMVTIARESILLTPGMAVAELQKTGLERDDAAVITVVLAERNSATGAAGLGKVQNLLATGRLREARSAAQSLPADYSGRAEAVRLVDEARVTLDALLAQAAEALRAPDELRAVALLRDAALISAEDAEEALRTVPLAPPADLRLVPDGALVKLFWRPVQGHDAETVYVVCRTEQRPPAAKTDGVVVHSGRGEACVDDHAPVAREVQYGVFAQAAERPSSRPATASIVVLPPVSRLEAEVGPASVALSWSAHPAAQEVRVTRIQAGGPAVQVPVTGGGCRAAGLAEGQPQHFEVVAVYRGLDGGELRSAAEQINATPRSEARPIPKLRARAVEVGGTVGLRVSWTPVDSSDVRIKRSATPPAWKFGTWVSPQEMAGFGEELTGRRTPGPPEVVIEATAPPGIHHLVPFSIGGTGIVVGRAAMVAVTDPVRHLVVTPFATYAKVSWEWPSSAQQAELSWELDGNGDCILINRAQYRSEGGARVPLGRAPYTVEVRAVIAVGETMFTAPPVQAVVEAAMDTVISYAISATPAIGPIGGRSKRVTFRSDQGCRDVRVQMVALPGRVMPMSVASGVTLLDTALTLQPGIPVEHHVSVPRSVRRPYWVRCFVMGGSARLIDPPISSLKET